MKGKKNMKLLRLFNDGKKTEAQFLDLSEMGVNPFDAKYYKNVETIENKDVEDILLYMLSHDDASFDEYDEEAISNPAQRLVYKELYAEFTKVQDSRKEIIDKIDNEFRVIESKYNEE